MGSSPKEEDKGVEEERGTGVSLRGVSPREWMSLRRLCEDEGVDVVADAPEGKLTNGVEERRAVYSFISGSSSPSSSESVSSPAPCPSSSEERGKGRRGGLFIKSNTDIEKEELPSQIPFWLKFCEITTTEAVQLWKN